MATMTVPSAFSPTPPTSRRRSSASATTATGANTLADGLEHLAAKVRQAHRDWLRGKARAAERVEMAEAAGR